MAIADLVKPVNFPNLEVLASKSFASNSESVNAFKTIIYTSEYPNLKLADAIWVPTVSILLIQRDLSDGSSVNDDAPVLNSLSDICARSSVCIRCCWP